MNNHLSEERDIQGLTAAAGIWMTAAVGVAVGQGRLGLALLSIALTWFTLAVVGKLEYVISARQAAKAEEAEKQSSR